MQCKCAIFLCFLILGLVYAEESLKSKNNESGNSDSVYKNKLISKRGILHFGQRVGIPNSYISAHSYNIPFGPLRVDKYPIGLRVPGLTAIPNHSATIPYPPRPSVLPAIFGPNVPYKLHSGDATVSSYQINYPQVNYHGHKIFNQAVLPATLNTQIVPNIISPNVYIPQTVSATGIINGVPLNNIYFPQKPLIPVTTAVHKPIIPQLQFPHQIPSITQVTSIPPASPVTPIFPGYLHSYPSVMPLAPTVHPPHLTPAQIPHLPSPTVPTTNLPTPGSTSTATDQWRPIIFSMTPTAASPTIPPPPLSLLPPYRSHHFHHTNIDDLSPTDQTFFLPQNPPVNPTESDQNVQQHHFINIDNDLPTNQQQPNQMHHHHHHHHQVQQTNFDGTDQFINHHQSDSGLTHPHSGIDFNGNEPNDYFGLSSYDVPLQGNKGYHY